MSAVSRHFKMPRIVSICFVRIPTLHGAAPQGVDQVQVWRHVLFKRPHHVRWERCGNKGNKNKEEEEEEEKLGRAAV